MVHEVKRFPISDERFRQLVVLDIKQESTPQQEAVLREDLNRWFQTLQALVQESQQTLAQRKAELLEAKRECQQEGPPGQRRYLVIEAQIKRQQAATQFFLTRVVTRQREVKALRYQRHQATYTANHDRRAETIRLQQEVEALQTALDQERSQSKQLLLGARALLDEPTSFPAARRKEVQHWIEAYEQWQHSKASAEGAGEQ